MTMPSEQKIMAGIDYAKGFLLEIDIKGLKPIIDLAQAYLECSGEMPKKEHESLCNKSFHYVCHGGATVKLIDCYGENEIFKCHHKGEKRWFATACEKCDGNLKGKLEAQPWQEKYILKNQVIDQCHLARLKEKAEFRNEYGQCYICKKRMPLVCKDCKKAEWEQKMEGLPDVIYKIERQTCAANECLPTCPSTAEGNFCGVRERVKKLYDSIRGYLMGKGEK